MTTADHHSRQLLDAVEAALALVRDYAGADPATLPAEPLPSLLEQCHRMLDETRPAPIRLLHHFACTGGTVLAKCVAALPNALLLSEIDPLSTVTYATGQPIFAPTDLVLNTRYAARDQDETVLIEIFRGGLDALRAAAGRKGQHLILRDHSHSHFCVDIDPESRPTLREMMPADVPLRSVVTLRHPVDSWLSLSRMGWHGTMRPATIDEYARRYLAFLARHEGCPQLRYEDFLENPAARLADLCTWLDLPWSEDALDLFPMIRMSGDSGRSGGILTPRSRREIPPGLRAEIAESPDLHRLCAVTGYDLAI